MNATPEKAKHDKSEAPQLSRLERLRKDWVPEWVGWVSPATVEALREAYMPDLPPLEGGAYLVGYLLDAGPTVAAGMGAGPLTSKDLMPWCEETGIELQPWEARTLRRLSIAYLNESHQAEKLGCEPPWKPTDFKPELTAKQLERKAERLALINL